jgi:hypothetical protein
MAKDGKRRQKGMKTEALLVLRLLHDLPASEPPKQECVRHSVVLGNQSFMSTVLFQRLLFPSPPHSLFPLPHRLTHLFVNAKEISNQQSKNNVWQQETE